MTKKSASSSPRKSDSVETFGFQAEVNRLLHIVTHALYSDQMVFVRELVSNAADACDKLRTLALTATELGKLTENLRIDIHIDPIARRITFSDNGIGMNRQELIENLGTIAHSGTAAFSEMIKNLDKDKDATQLIGQFGVGFYASFMVADTVRVISRKAGENETFLWSSTGQDGYKIETATEQRAQNGTDIILDLKDGCKDLAQKAKISQAIHKYSDHIGFPIFLHQAGLDADGEQLNEAAALWTKSKNDITTEQYQNFYRHNGGIDMPFHTLHWHAEGVIDYTALLYIPSMRPIDLYDPKRRHHVKLYVRRVFISDSVETLLPPWLRFMRGIIDSADLPLNISRETLQANPVLTKIRQGVTKKILAELLEKSKDADSFRPFWTAFGPVLKEALYESGEYRESVLKLCRFASTALDEFDLNGTSLADYVARMKEGQKSIYYMIGEDIDAMRQSPQLEAFIDKNIEVLLMKDTIDAFWIEQVREYDGKIFQSVTKGLLDLPDDTEKSDEKKQEEKAEQEGTNPPLFKLLEQIAAHLKDDVKTVRPSKRLKNSLSCLVADQHDVDMRTEQLLRAHQAYDQHAKRILEINTEHPLISGLTKTTQTDDEIALLAALLLDQALIQEGERPKDPVAFAKNITSLMQRAYQKSGDNGTA